MEVAASRPPSRSHILLYPKRDDLRSRDAPGAEKRSETKSGHDDSKDQSNGELATATGVGIKRFVERVSAVEGGDGEQKKKSADELIPNDSGRLNNVWDDVFGEVPRDARFESHHDFRLASGGRA